MGCRSSHDTFCSVQSLSPTQPCSAEVPTPRSPYHPSVNGCFVLLSPERCPRGVQEKPAQPCLLHKERAQRVSALTHAIIIFSPPSALMHTHPSPQLLQQMLLPGFCTPSSGDGGVTMWGHACEQATTAGLLPFALPWLLQSPRCISCTAGVSRSSGGSPASPVRGTAGYLGGNPPRVPSS